MLRHSTRRSFYIVVSRTGNDHKSWCWEIRRKRSPMGVKLFEGGYRSYDAAQLAGKQALEDFLNGLCVDSKSPSQSQLTGTEIASERHPYLGPKGFAVTFIVHATRGAEATTTIRLSVTVAIAKGRALAEEGWRVFITAPDGMRYHLSEFDKLLSLSPALYARS
jgi:hypothetical protein